MVRDAIHTQIAALNVNIAFVDRWLQLHVIFGSFDIKSVVLQGITLVKRFIIFLLH